MSILIVLGVLVLALVLFAFELVPLEVASLLVVCLLCVTGVLTAREALAGYSNDTVIFIFTLLAMTQGLSATGVIPWVGQRMGFFSRFSPRVFLGALMAIVGAFSSVISNTVTVAAFLPIAIGAAERAKLAKSRVLIPLAYASMLGGTVFLYGTSTNLVVSEAISRMGMAPIGFSELTPVGLPIALVGTLLVVVLGPALLPARTGQVGADGYVLRDFLTEAFIPEKSPYIGKPLSDISSGLGFRVLGLVRHGQALTAAPTRELEAEDRLIIEEDRADVLRIKDLQGIELRSDARWSNAELKPEDTVLVEASIPPGSPLARRSLKDVKFSERFKLVALGIHRRPALQRVTKLQLLQRFFGAHALSDLPLMIGDVLLVRGAKTEVAALADGASLTILTDHDYEPPRYPKALLAVSILAAALILGTLDVLPLPIAGLCGMVAMIITGCVDARTAFRVDWRVVLLIGSMMALGLAMEKSGAGEYLGQKVVQLAPMLGNRGVLCLLMVLTIALSAPMSNQAAALVILPVAISAAKLLGVDPRPFAIGICFSASLSFITPLEPACVLVYGPGHYRFSDFFRLGTPLTLALVAVLTWAVPIVWPF